MRPMAGDHRLTQETKTTLDLIKHGRLGVPCGSHYGWWLSWPFRPRVCHPYVRPRLSGVVKAKDRNPRGRSPWGHGAR